MATKQFLRGAAAIAAVVALALALANIVAASSSSPPYAPEPQPDPKQEWRTCEDSAVERHALAVESLCVTPWPVEISKPWALDLQLKHRGHHQVRDAEMTLKVYILGKLPVYTTTEDFCKSSKKKKREAEEAPGALVNMIARAAKEAKAAAGNDDEGDDGKKEGGDNGKSGCPLKAGETTLLHFDGDWSAWAPESQYLVRVVVKDRERPDPQSELLCVDIDVVARKPPSLASSSSVAAS